MERRRFLKLAGFSTASLFFTGADARSGTPYPVFGFPTAVSILSGGQWLSLKGSDGRWALEQSRVELEHAGPSLNIRLRAPDRELEKVRLSWRQAFATTAKGLGDHWERSYGDLAWDNITQPRKAPWYLLINDGRDTLAFGVKTGAKAICYWQVTPQELDLVLDTHSGGAGVLLGDRTLPAATIIVTKSLPGETPFGTDHRFCGLLCDKPVLPAKPVYGINDWYFAYGNNSKKLILDSTRAMADLAPDTNNRPFSVIDEGWASEDFKRSNAKFGDMSAVADEIKKIGMRPGLWTRALLANGSDRSTLLLPVRSGETESKDRYLDPTLPENLQRIADTVKLYTDWGFELVKHDYSTYDLFGRWGFQMEEEMTVPGWHCNDRAKTNAEILLELYATIRHAAGGMVLIGCNTISHLSAGLFELNRIGDDTSGKEWARTLKMGVNTLGFRLPQHNTFYAADGDCVGLTTQIPWEKNKQWLQLLAESSAPLFISAQPEATGPEQKAYIKKCFAMAARAQPLGEPLDWLRDPRPAKWRLNGRIVDFDWA